MKIHVLPITDAKIEIDIDSMLVVTSSLTSFNVIDVTHVRIGFNQARPDKNIKLQNVLMEVENIQNNDNFTWSYFKFCDLNRNTIYFLFYHKKDQHLGNIRNEFLIKILKVACQKLPLSARSRIHNCASFYDSDLKGKILLYAADWPVITVEMDNLLL